MCNPSRRVLAPLALSVLLPACDTAEVGPPASPPVFETVQADLFSAPGAQSNAWADYDGDGDLDLFVGFRGAPNRLYRNDEGAFTDVAGEVGLAVQEETRASAWGDWDGDGDLDLYVGFADLGIPNRLYRNEGGRFVDVADEVGVAVGGTTRQPAFVDYDGDGDLDLFVAFRDKPNHLFRNDGARFSDVTEASGIGDPRRTVGVAWFDMDGDADLDAFVANQNGDEDGVFINQGDGTFIDRAADLGMSQPGRPEALGSVGTAVADYDNDGDLDLLVASYGPDVLWENRGDGTFANAAPGTALAGDHHSVAAGWADYDGDGWVDLYVNTFLSSEVEARDYLFRNEEGTFVEVTPEPMIERGSSHGVAWADFDGDGDVDLALANNHAEGHHPLYRNLADPAGEARALAVHVTDADGRWTRSGATVTLRRSSDGFTTARVVDSGGGYASQGVVPVYFFLPPAGTGPVELSVSWYEGGSARRASLSVDPDDDERTVRIRAGG
jgi:hypothetical protein